MTLVLKPGEHAINALENAVREAIPWADIDIQIDAYQDSYHDRYVEVTWQPSDHSPLPIEEPYYDLGHIYPEHFTRERVFSGFCEANVERLEAHREAILEALSSVLAVSVPTVWLTDDTVDEPTPDDDGEAADWCRITDMRDDVDRALPEMRAKVEYWGHLVIAAQYDHAIYDWLRSLGFEALLPDLSRLCQDVGRLHGMGGEDLSGAIDEIIDEISETMHVERMARSQHLYGDAVRAYGGAV